MKKLYQFIALMIIIIGIVGAVFVYNRPIFADAPRLPKPSSYPFEKAEQMANEKLPIWLNSLVSTNHCMDFGFQSCEETQRATLGKPYISYAFNVADLARQPNIQGDVRSQLDGGVNIDFPVLVDGAARTNISVVFQNGVWEVGRYGGFQPTQIVALQQRLQSQGITERVDIVGFSDAVFGLLDYKNQTFLIPLEDKKNVFPDLDWRGDHMYQLSEIAPRVHVQAQKMMVEYERNVRENEERNRNSTPFVMQATRVVKPAPTYIPPPVYPAPNEPTAVGATSLPVQLSTSIPQQAPNSTYPAP